MESIPLHAEADGVMQIRGSRVTLDVVLAAFGEGATAEEMRSTHHSHWPMCTR